ncbi:MAG: 4Fe-4S binding protein [Myxococcales bacterium]|nr:4Fe-4S binding protein [Myxococcales bacterium]
MKQLAIVSGKGGTGKTSLTAAIAALAQPTVTADCDVDAADLHLILRPETKAAHELEGGFKACLDKKRCLLCGQCAALCRYGAISEDIRVDAFECEGCGVCADHCPVQAITLTRQKAGDWFESETRFGPMVHARLGIAQENSGKLVARIRNRAREIAAERNLSLLLIDGPPGIGCPVISAVTGVDLVLAITEPTPSGIHDLRRVLELTRHFRIPVGVCVNKADLNPEQTKAVATLAPTEGAAYLGAIPFDNIVTRAMIAGKSLPEFGDHPVTAAIVQIWQRVERMLHDR